MPDKEEKVIISPLVKEEIVNSEGLTPDEQIAYAQLVLKTLAIDDQTRLKNGMKLREEMHLAVAHGQQPTGYRVDWINETMNLLSESLRLSAEKFNTLHNDDRISTLDFCDVLIAIHNEMKAR